MNTLSNKNLSGFTSFSFSFLICFLGVSFVAFAQQAPPQKLPVPPNMVWLQDRLFIDKTEVANIHWLEYLHFLQKEVTQNQISQAFYDAQVPDTTIGNAKAGNMFTHPAYRYHPVTGISYEQVLRFCEWRSAIVSEIYNKNNPAPIGLHWKFTYRLPSIKEWEKAAAGSLDISLYPYGLTRLFEVQADAPVLMRPPAPLINYRNHKAKRFTLKNVENYAPNLLGIYQMIGNVAEMTATKGIAKGGSWRTRKANCKIRKSQRYYAPDNWVGFRCVCEVKLVDKETNSVR